MFQTHKNSLVVEDYAHAVCYFCGYDCSWGLLLTILYEYDFLSRYIFSIDSLYIIYDLLDHNIKTANYIFFKNPI